MAFDPTLSTAKGQDTYAYDENGANITTRSFREVFMRTIQQAPYLMGRVQIGAPIYNTKHEWADYIVKGSTVTVTAPYTAGGLVLTLSAVDGLTEGDLLQVGDVTYQVASIAGLDVTVTVVDGTDANIAADTAVLSMTAQLEGSCDSNCDGAEISTLYNNAQIFRCDATLTESEIATRNHITGTGEALMARRIEDSILKITRMHENALINGVRVDAVNNSGKRYAGGVINMIKNNGGVVVDAAGGDFSLDTYNLAITEMRSKGADGSITVVAHPNQASKIRALNIFGQNPVVAQQSQVAGTSVVALADQFGGVANVVYSYQMPQDKVLILDIANVFVRPLGDRLLSVTDASNPSCDYEQYKVISEVTFEFLKIQSNHALIEGLAV